MNDFSSAPDARQARVDSVRENALKSDEIKSFTIDHSIQRVVLCEDLEHDPLSHRLAQMMEARLWPKPKPGSETVIDVQAREVAAIEHSGPLEAERQAALPLWARPGFIPAELSGLPQWVVWRLVRRGGKPTKEPYQALAPSRKAKSNDPATWADYDLAVAVALDPRNKLDGIGFVFSADDPYCGIDFDNCVVDGELMPWALDHIQAMQAMGAYGEISPSGNGIKLFGRANLPGKGKNRKGFGDDGAGGIEVYSEGRFFTVTGDRWCGGGEIPDCSKLVNALYTSLSVKPEPKVSPNGERPDFRVKAGASGRLAIIERARKYLDTVEGAVAGQRGHDKTFGAACRVGVGFGLTIAETVGLLRGWNQAKCSPPWDDADLVRKVHQAHEHCEQAPGWLIDAPPSNGNGRAGSNGYHEANGQSGEHEAKAERMSIEITTIEHEVVDRAIVAISAEPNLYQRARSLVSVVEEVRPEKKQKGVDRAEGTPRIVPLPGAQIRRLMSVHATWKRTKKGQLVDSHVPGWAVDMVGTMGSWDGIRPLVGITEIPTFRPDGSLICKPGYDAETGLLYRPSIDFPEIPRKPTQEDAKAASDTILDIVEDFPFDGSKNAWLAALLTPMVRFAIDGPTPLFLLDANVAGAGKTKLVDLIAVLATGREMARGNYSADDVEMHKTLLSIALAGDQLVLFDNVAGGGSIGGPALDRFLTARTMNGRILGRSEMTGDVEVNTVLYATGNNLGLKGDSLRRIVPIPLQSPEERPEERQDFTIKGDLLGYAKQNRGNLVVAALTILRAYIEAGKPDQKLTPMDYTAWCGLVRNAVNWATGTDPCKGRLTLIANDDETNKLKAMVDGWQQLCELACMSALSAAQALKTLDDHAGQTHSLREILMGWSKDGRLPSSRTIGNQLSKIKGRNLGGKALYYSMSDGNRCWFVKPVA